MDCSRSNPFAASSELAFIETNTPAFRKAVLIADWCALGEPRRSRNEMNFGVRLRWRAQSKHCVIDSPGPGDDRYSVLASGGGLLRFRGIPRRLGRSMVRGNLYYSKRSDDARPVRRRKLVGHELAQCRDRRFLAHCILVPGGKIATLLAAMGVRFPSHFDVGPSAVPFPGGSAVQSLFLPGKHVGRPQASGRGHRYFDRSTCGPATRRTQRWST